MTKRDGTDLRSEGKIPDSDDSVGITGMIRLVTEFGAFVIVNGRTVFTPFSCSTDSLRNTEDR
jgi:hypothetical protein